MTLHSGESLAFIALMAVNWPRFGHVSATSRPRLGHIWPRLGHIRLSMATFFRIWPRSGSWPPQSMVFFHSLGQKNLFRVAGWWHSRFVASRLFIRRSSLIPHPSSHTSPKARRETPRRAAFHLALGSLHRGRFFHQIVNEHDLISIYTDFAPAMGSKFVSAYSRIGRNLFVANELQNLEFRDSYAHIARRGAPREGG